MDKRASLFCNNVTSDENSIVTLKREDYGFKDLIWLYNNDVLMEIFCLNVLAYLGCAFL